MSPGCNEISIGTTISAHRASADLAIYAFDPHPSKDASTAWPCRDASQDDERSRDHALLAFHLP
jgi:hypothetical protein